jgi:hypothetical protein
MRSIMSKSTKGRACKCATFPVTWRCGQIVALLLLVMSIIMLEACGGSSSSGSTPTAGSAAGNWQFTVSPPPDSSFSGGLQGGFLLQNGTAISGAAVYAVSAPNIQSPLSNPCNSGSAPITGTISSQSVTFTAVAGSQTFSFTGTLSSDGSTITGTYSSTAGTAADGTTPCGSVQSNLQWSAILVPSITGTIQGSFHSTGGTSGLANQDFPLSGTLTQGPNIGATNATVTGTLTFIDPLSSLSVYPCFEMASVNGQISGNSVVLQIIGIDGSNDGQIGGPAGGPIGVNPVTFDSVQGGAILHGVGPSYLVATKSCPGSVGGIVTAGDVGNICVALGTTTACQQPIALTPAVITFPPQPLGSTATTQTITLTNNTASTLSSLALQWNVNNGAFNAPTDFNSQPNFAEQDSCASPFGSNFSLGAGASCTIKVSFSPQESCPWLPFGTPPSVTGSAPQWCPLPLAATLTVSSPTSSDNDNLFAVPITGFGISAVQPSVPELDFGAEEALVPPESSLPQTVAFTNTSNGPVQILGRASCVNPPKGQLRLPSPRLDTSPVAGLQVVSNGSGGILPITPDGGTIPPTITYNCDSDPGTVLPNFQISADTCTGALLVAGASCSVQVAYVPQPNTNIASGLDYFLELNTVQCFDEVSSNCEIDSGRFPVELKANTPSPLRMAPGAGLDFGNQTVGKSSAALTISLLNDPTLTDPQTVTFIGKITVQGNYAETDDCPVTLAPGASCTLNVTFKPSSTGFIPGALTINYAPEPNGSPQFVFLRGTGQ